MMEYEKDYSLLRPFDMEAAKRGESVCFYNGKDSRKFVAGPDSKGDFILQCKQGEFHLCSNSFDGWKMAPLCWVRVSADDPTLRPVYNGNVLYFYWSQGVSKVEAMELLDDDRVLVRHMENVGLIRIGDTTVESVFDITWNQPKVKREVKLLGWFDGYQFFLLRDGAEPQWPSKRVPSEDKVIEIEE